MRKKNKSQKKGRKQEIKSSADAQELRVSLIWAPLPMPWIWRTEESSEGSDLTRPHGPFRMTLVISKSLAPKTQRLSGSTPTFYR